MASDGVAKGNTVGRQALFEREDCERRRMLRISQISGTAQGSNIANINSSASRYSLASTSARPQQNYGATNKKADERPKAQRKSVVPDTLKEMILSEIVEKSPGIAWNSISGMVHIKNSNTAQRLTSCTCACVQGCQKPSKRCKKL